MNKKTTLFLIQIFCYFSLIVALVVQLSSCHQIDAKKDSQTDREIKQVKQWISSKWPKRINDYKTTNSQLYLVNLNSSIKVSRRLFKQTQKFDYGNQLASKLYFRYRILGNFSDAIEALELINAISQSNPEKANIYLTLATIQSGFHQFDAALASLKQAQELGKNTQQITQFKDEIKYSLGQYKHYQDIMNNAEINTLIKAKYALVNNKFKQASLFYKKAMDEFRDTDPFKLSWLQLQQGIAFLRYNELDSAKVFFESAHQRFPEYYLVTEHLAETELLLGNLQSARKLYQQVIAQTNNPAFYAQLAKVETQLGHHTRRKQALAQAQKRFDELTKNYPTATGDHAVGFYLNNKQAKKALKLAQLNLNNRKNIESYELLIQSALANNDEQLACKTYSDANKLEVKPLEFYQLSSKLSCSNKPTTTH